jgi:hypothetical protein
VNLYEKSELINALLFDIRAEYLITGMLTDGIPLRDIMVSFDGDLKRKWSADISHAGIEKYENGEEAINIHLNRSGIYDALPEALFHEFFDNRNATGEDMAKESMKIKAVEKYARLFFSPFEYEIFLFNLFVVDKENKEFENLHSGLLSGLISDFWKTDKIPVEYVAKFCKYLPLAHKIIGDYEMTARCLESILGEKVTIRLSADEDIAMDTAADFRSVDIRLGNMRLGYDMIPGVRVTGFIGRLTVVIGPVVKTDIKDFFDKGKAGLLLKSFYSYFIPVELDVETEILTEESKRNFILGGDEEHEKIFLGYNTVI